MRRPPAIVFAGAALAAFAFAAVAPKGSRSKVTETPKKRAAGVNPRRGAGT